VRDLIPERRRSPFQLEREADRRQVVPIAVTVHGQRLDSQKDGPLLVSVQRYVIREAGAKEMKHQMNTDLRTTGELILYLEGVLLWLRIDQLPLDSSLVNADTNLPQADLQFRSERADNLLVAANILFVPLTSIKYYESSGYRGRLCRWFTLDATDTGLIRGRNRNRPTSILKRGVKPRYE
jgi:hypothetical protein